MTIFFQEMLPFFPELLEITEPLLKEDWTQANEEIFQLPFENVTKFSHPKVDSMYSIVTDLNTLYLCNLL